MSHKLEERDYIEIIEEKSLEKHNELDNGSIEKILRENI